MECLLALAGVKTLLISLIQFPSTLLVLVLPASVKELSHPQIKPCKCTAEVKYYTKTYVFVCLYRDRVNFILSVHANLISTILHV